MALLLCPHCGARGIGKVGSSQYYCWECCVEFKATRKGWLVYEVLDDGSLAAVAGTRDRSRDRGVAGSMGAPAAGPVVGPVTGSAPGPLPEAT